MSQPAIRQTHVRALVKLDARDRAKLVALAYETGSSSRAARGGAGHGAS